MSIVHGPVRATMAADVLRGMLSVPKALPPKYFYDARGSRLFDAICDTPEYYPTRTERALLARVAADVVARVRPAELAELGSGAARKTRVFLSAMGAGRFVPIDISEPMLVASARDLVRDYPWLSVYGVVADLDADLRSLLPAPAGPRLWLFLGGTIGNFDDPAAIALLSRVRAAMGPGDALAVGMDLVKAPWRLIAAYNDAVGITAEFNRNVLRVINRELGADFDVESFDHVALWRPELEQIEMHLEARRPMVATIGRLGVRVRFASGERIHTENSRKYTRASARRIAGAAGLRELDWLVSDDGAFALALLAPESP
ncbi:MAG: L-histidine N(alpha)-methyltransferase [Deltaproteobacteria bacterium]|nr:MAG: L-histidine N(alpha)-methyltransferase [Deltaproteobacteria bacterium]